MDKDKNQSSDTQQNEGQPKEVKDRSRSAFNEPRNRDEKSTTNIEEEADLEQERKEAMTERD